MVRGRADKAHAGCGVADLGDPGVDLGPGQLAALTGLGALGHLDLYLTGADQILAGDSESTGSHLLDRALEGVAVGERLEASRVLAAFARVRLAAETVHGDGERLMGLLRDGAVAHRSGLEAPDDRLDRLDLVERERVPVVRLEVHKAAQGAQAFGLVVDEFRVVLERGVVAGPGGVLELGDGERVE